MSADKSIEDFAIALAMQLNFSLGHRPDQLRYRMLKMYEALIADFTVRENTLAGKAFARLDAAGVAAPAIYLSVEYRHHHTLIGARDALLYAALESPTSDLLEALRAAAGSWLDHATKYPETATKPWDRHKPVDPEKVAAGAGALAFDLGVAAARVVLHLPASGAASTRTVPPLPVGRPS